MMQPAPPIGHRIIDIGIPQGCSYTLEFEQALAVMANELTDMWRPDHTRNWYMITDTETNRRHLTELILRFPDIVTRESVNTVDPDFLDEDSGTAA